ncbi:MAG TPA: PAS domain-containing protein [Patescibacteria group bacterium]|nr:PAS domain-containing protein [Patescibacteria group bacterium]
MKLRSQISIGYGFVLLLALILIVVTAIYLTRIGQQVNSIVSENNISIRASEQMIAALNSINADAARAMNPAGGQSMGVLQQKISDNIALFKKNYELATQGINEPGESEVLRSMGTRFKTYSEGLSVITPELYYSTHLPQYEIIVQQCKDVIEINRAAMLSKEQEAKNTYNKAFLTLAISSVGFILLIYLVAFRLPTMIVKPMEVLIGKIAHITEGDYRQTLELEDRSFEELTQLADSFNLMTARLKEYDDSNLTQIVAQKSRIESIVRSLSNAIIVLDEKRSIILVNQVAARVLGISEAQLIGKLASEVAIYSPLMQELLKTIYNEEAEKKNDFLKVSIDGKEEFFEKDVRKVYDESDVSFKRFLGHIISLKNVTTYKRVDESKKNFIHNLSQALTAPLSSISINLSTLEYKNGLTAEQQTIIEAARRENQKLLELAGELAEMWDSGREDAEVLSFQPVDPESFIFEALQPLGGTIQEKKIFLLTEFDTGLPSISVDPDKMTWALTNMLRKAVQLTPQNGTIKLQISYVGKAVQFCIEDSSASLKDAAVSNEYTSQSKEEIENELAVVKDVILAHNGKMWLEYRKNVGNQFYFYVPAA